MGLAVMEEEHLKIFPRNQDVGRIRQLRGISRYPVLIVYYIYF